MEYCFGSKKLEELYTKEKNAHKYPNEVVDGFFEVIATIESAKDIRDIRILKSLRYERLQGSRSDERSLRINRNWRLIVKEEETKNGLRLYICGIENHYE